MNDHPKYSVVIPVYNRPEELDELLGSLVQQQYRNFEVIIVEDGSTQTAEAVYEKYSSLLSIQYLFKPNSGPGPSRNMGFTKARGDYFVIFDSDCILPPSYFEEVEHFMAFTPMDAWGGPDRGHEKFTPLQQAMAFTMSSVLTTGGIRGGANSSEKFQPRSFNMGISRAVFEQTQGFNFDRQAEDIELSIRIRKAGFKVGLIPNAFVYHKRRSTLRQFYQQVKNFGKGRAMVGKVHPGEIKPTHWFPALFLAGLVSLPIISWLSPMLGSVVSLGIGIYLLCIFIDGWRVTRSIRIGLLCVVSTIVQFTGYGVGFIGEMVRK